MSKRNSKEISDEAFIKEVSDKGANLKQADRREIDPPANPEESLVPVPLETIPLNVTLPCSVYLKQSGKVLIFKRQGEKVNYKTALDLQKKGSSTAYVHTAFWKIFTDSLENMKMDTAATKEEQAVRTRRLLLAYGQELEKQIREPKRPIFQKMRALSSEICESLRKDQANASKYLRKADDPLVYISNHAMNTCVYAVLMGIKLQISLQKLKDLAFAAYVHDVGNLYLPKRILYKKSDLTDEDRALIQTHPRKGAELLSEMGYNGAITKAVLYHHERMDGSGYPTRAKGPDIPVLARIIAIAETFDAMTSNRPYAKAISYQEALDQISKMAGKFDHTILTIVSPPPVATAAVGS